ncbi:MAG: CHAT domain-containing protein [Anaerolineales bacterium]
MSLLRLTQHIEKEDNYRIEMAFEDDDGTRQAPEARFEFKMTDGDRADLRWYLEDYLQYPIDPAPKIAERIEGRIRDLGIELFKKIFQANDDTRDLWATLRDKLADTRVEVATDVKGATALPWELLRDPKTDEALVLRAKAFVRSYNKPAQKIHKPELADKVRILLVICRPGGSADVPFRSVSGTMLKGLTDAARERFELDVLRPPTFEQLSKTLRNAKADGKPYHIVHFDGHGGYLNTDTSKPAEFLRTLIPLMLRGPRDGSHGYLFFEHPKPDGSNDNTQLVDGPALGKLLAETDTPVLILNACRSAHADIQEKPDVEKDVDESQSQVRAFGSLAQEVMNEGVAGVVAMRYNVYVVTAAQFVADLYAALAGGQGLGEAVSMGRKQLAAQPLREIAFDPIALQDWSVPVAYEAAPIQLFPKPLVADITSIKIDLSKDINAEDNLPRPDVGFFGRDETILALDRAFDTQPVVLLHAYAGSGKTMTAAEFARWYKQTGGLDGPILFTSFEQYRPLAQVLSAVEETYRSVLEQNNIQWLALDEEQRLNITLQIFKRIPPLWIWDNVEPVNGFPAGADSAWSLSEQRELRTFLQIVTAQSKTKFLLNSRRDEREWLGDIPKRVTLPPMPMQERVRLTRALADKHGKRIADVKDWLPLLRFTQGNPMTITVIAGQALRDGISSAKQIEAYLNKLHNGETAFDDEASEGRSKSLGASLSYGFEQGFSEDERKVLALLHFFQGFVDVRVLKLMVADEDWGIDAKDFTRETGIAILGKAADIGLLTSHGGGYYTIHPALPWFFKSLFEQCYPEETPQSSDDPNRKSSTLAPHASAGVANRKSALRAYVESMGELGNYYTNQYIDGNRDVIASLGSEEPNLLYARSLARQHGWWGVLTSTMQGLYQLYDHTGRRAEWKRLVEEIVPDFVGADDLPLLGREEQWDVITQYRMQLAKEEHNWEKAEQIQSKAVQFHRQRTAEFLKRSPNTLNDFEKNIVRWLAVALGQLSDIQREQGKAECIDPTKEAIEIYHAIGDYTTEAIRAFNLGRVYAQLPALRNLDEAENWFKRSLELVAEGDRVGRGKSTIALGNIASERFDDAKKEGKTEEELLKHLNAAIDYYQQALALLPLDAVNDLAVTHHQLGLIYKKAGDLERALDHYNKSVQYKEAAGNIYSAGTTRFNIALMFYQNGRLADALLYARAALRNFESYGGRAKDMEDETNGLIELIKGKMKG